jgi:hypothetical protein
VTKNDNSYVALLCDAVASRRLAPRARARLQEELRSSLPELNRTWRSHLVGRFAITGGDQLECLLDGPHLVWEIAHGVRSKFPDVDWVIACGRGGLTTLPHPRATAPELDGPCFHAARAALESAKAKRLVFAFGGFGPRVEALAAYYSALFWSWTPTQRRSAAELRWPGGGGGGGPVRDNLSQRLGVHPTAVSHMKRRLAWPLVAAGDTMFQAALLEAS